MLATPSPSAPTQDGTWAYEIKWDGIRALATVAEGTVRFTSRNGNDLTGRYPELQALGAAVRSATGDRDCVLDGEIVATDEHGRPSFERLQQRTLAARPTTSTTSTTSTTPAVDGRRNAAPVTFVVFDVLVLDGRDCTALPYRDRRRLLEGLALPPGPWIVPSSTGGDPEPLLAFCEERGLEGIVAKKLDSPYLPGQRTDAWRKVKLHRRQEFVVGGWVPGSGTRASRLGALVLGVHDRDGSLRYCGRVGTGFTGRELDRLRDVLRPLERPTSPFTSGSPPPETVWTEPRVVVEVRFTEWTESGVLRHPSYVGQRDDRDPGSVVREE